MESVREDYSGGMTEEPRPKGSEGLSGCRNRSGGVLSVF